MKLTPMEFDLCERVVGDFDFGWILIYVDCSFNYEATFCCRTRDEVDDSLMADQWFATPVLADETEKTIFELVPLACSRWKVTNCEFQAKFIC